MSTAPESGTIRVPGEVIPAGTAQSGQTRQSFTGIALIVAILADILQILLLPLMLRGFLSPLNAALDIAIGLAMVRLVGWHWAFLPSFLGELLPVLNGLPCWTLAVLYVRAERAKKKEQKP